ncbi:hypothetical protein Poli38472_002981 [Pythium oligandrum]|uniref:RRM domain-containing protein n=1 Tax=Pythium oligandrum TaxID=41045 RepID=A0A8K1C5Z4_PYTOL|nr:hypothetical protein Poli38472_002981 [Pythium oligandrum]|eukprot:TMW57056.1 hypothetical protein Poli38472_002981 [Pythium oligandrum]
MTRRADEAEDVEMNAAEEEAIRAKLRESGWEKKKLRAQESKGDDDDDAKPMDVDDDKKKKMSGSGSSSTRDRGRERDDRKSGRSSRRSRSSRRRDKDRRRSDRDRGSRRRRSLSASKSRSRSPSSSRRREKDRGRSRTQKRRSRSASSSRSVSKARDTKRSRRSRSPAEKDVKMTEEKDKPEAAKEKEEHSNGAKEPEGDKKDGSSRDVKDKSDHRKSRKSSRRSRSASRSRSHRSRRRHRSKSRSRSGSRSRRRRSKSRSRSYSRSRRHRDRDRRRRSRSRSRSYSRRHRSKSKEKKPRRDANSSPEPHEHPPAPVMAANPLNSSIAQLMQQYPTMSLQDIIAKMQASNITMTASASMKPARELYVGNLPPNITGPQLQEFLGTIIQQVGLSVQPGNPILSTWISTDGHFAFCEMRSVEECNLALLLNQLPLLGQPLKFGRPKSFVGPAQPMPIVSARTQTALANLGCTPNPQWFATPSLSDIAGATGSLAATTASLLGFGSTSVPSVPAATPFVAPAAASLTGIATTSDTLLMTNIPVVLSEDQVKELVQPFGALKRFTFVADPTTGQSTGQALFEYEDTKVTDDAMQGLNGLDLGGIPIAVQRAAASTDETSVVVKMANMVSEDELRDDEEYADLKEDVEEECKRFGLVVAMEIPRPKDGEDVPGVGNIYVQFEDASQSGAALKALSGRKFGGKIVQVTYFPMTKFAQKAFA